jgi:hypothetical protein
MLTKSTASIPTIRRLRWAGRAEEGRKILERAFNEQAFPSATIVGDRSLRQSVVEERAPSCLARRFVLLEEVDGEEARRDFGGFDVGACFNFASAADAQ